MPLPFVTDIAVRLSAGLLGTLLATPWRVVPPAFFRTHCVIALGLLTIAAVFQGTGGGAVFVLLAASAAAAYLASIGWGLGLARLGAPLTVLALLGTGWVMLGAGGLTIRSADLWGAAQRLCSAFLLGSTLSAMLLGHHYLTAPAMSIDPLRRFVAFMLAAVSLRVVTAEPSIPLLLSGSGGDPLYVVMRWGVGIVATAVAAVMAWKTVQIRSTQSATGILYIAMTFVLSGELTDMLLARAAGPTSP